MTTLMGILRFVGKASLQVLKVAVAFATAMVAKWFLFIGWSFLQQDLRFRWMDTASSYGWKYVGSAVFLGCFYETFSLLEAEMTTRKKVLVTSLGIMFAALALSVAYVRDHSQVPAPDIAEFFRWPRPPVPARPYEEAIYDVYSDLFQQPPSLLDRLASRPQYIGGVAIVEETTIQLEDGNLWLPSTHEEFKDRHSDKTFKLQRKFSLPSYVLITKTEEDHILRGMKECLAFQQNHPGYLRFIELSGVDFNKDQTRASITMMQLDEYGTLCRDSYNGLEKYLELEKNRNGKWRVTKMQGISTIN